MKQYIHVLSKHGSACTTNAPAVALKQQCCEVHILLCPGVLDHAGDNGVEKENEPVSSKPLPKSTFYLGESILLQCFGCTDSE